MDNHSVIMRIDEYLKKDPRLRDAAGRAKLFDICVRNSQLTGMQLFDQFRGHLNVVTLQRLIATWDTWRGALSNTLIVAQSRTSERRTRRRHAGDKRERADDSFDRGVDVVSRPAPDRQQDDVVVESGRHDRDSLRLRRTVAAREPVEAL